MVGSAVSHCEPADCGCYHSVNSLARPDGNKIVDWSFLISATWENTQMIVLNSLVLKVS